MTKKIDKWNKLKEWLLHITFSSQLSVKLLNMILNKMEELEDEERYD